MTSRRKLRKGRKGREEKAKRFVKVLDDLWYMVIKLTSFTYCVVNGVLILSTSYQISVSCVSIV